MSTARRPSAFADARVAVVISEPVRSGAELQALLLTRALIAAGHAVDVVAIEGSGPLAADFTRSGAALHVMDADPAVAIDRPAISTALQRLLFRLRCDIVVPFCRVPNLTAAYAWRASGARVGLWNQRDAGLGLDGRPSQRLAVSLASTVVSNSAHALHMLAARFGIDARTARVVRNGVVLSPARLTPMQWRTRLGVAADVPLVVMVANLTSSKANARVVPAWQAVQQKHASGPRPVLVLAGRYGDGYAALHGALRDAQLLDTVCLPGSVRDVAGLLETARVGLFLADAEGLPNALVECMHAGLPVVASDIAGVREALPSSMHHGLVRVGDFGSAAEGVRALLADPAGAQVMGALLRAHAAQTFSIAAASERWLQVLREAWVERAGSA